MQKTTTPAQNVVINSSPTTVFPSNHPLSNRQIKIMNWSYLILLGLSIAVLLTYNIMKLVDFKFPHRLIVGLIITIGCIVLILISNALVTTPRLMITDTAIEFTQFTTKRIQLADIDFEKSKMIENYNPYRIFSLEEKDGWWFTYGFGTLDRFKWLFAFRRGYNSGIMLKFKHNKRRPVVITVANISLDGLLEEMRTNAYHVFSY